MYSRFIIYILGGNTFYFQELKKSKADKLISKHIEKGKICMGTAAIVEYI
ncbi:hypothetical protein D1632_09310 [Chryseobacterium nematophagum]|uniref:Uncharacterized protein n=1 Tax=Chryseobacterium nematophagum TaxID=2305228 RepID=A0A3M7LFB5_9FLAO|nr:hypothetical protein D1632_09310 [Chryseobacterium nematophagum]